MKRSNSTSRLSSKAKDTLKITLDVSTKLNITNMTNTSTSMSIDTDKNFKVWLQNKSLRDRAIELLSKLSVSRSEEDDSLREVAIALCAVDSLLQSTISHNNNMSMKSSAVNDLNDMMYNDTVVNDNKVGKEKLSSSFGSGPKPLRIYWMKWAMEAHSFNRVILSDSDVKALSAAVHEYLDTNDEGVKVLPSLKYFFPAVSKKPNEKPKPLTNDQKVQNSIYIREMKKLWKEATIELDDRVKEYVGRKMEGYLKTANSNNISIKEDMTKLRMRYEKQILNEMSLKQMITWVEEDEDMMSKRVNEDEQQRQREAKISHEQWVRSKDSLRIRIPENLTIPKIPLSYGREYSGVRPLIGPSSLSIVKAMADSGLKYMHANSRAKQGNDGDLEKTRKQLLQLGHIFKENFDKDEDNPSSSTYEYERHLRNNPILKEKKDIEQQMKENSVNAYEEWIVSKDMRDMSLKCLDVLPVTPNIKIPTDDISIQRKSLSSSISSMISLRKSFNNISTTMKYSNEDYQYIINIGKALKQVDRSLFTQWSKWCENVIKTNIATILWDFFEPKGCDVHSNAYSQIRDTFLKLLKPGYDYKNTFIEFVKKQSRSSTYDDDNNHDMTADDKDSSMLSYGLSKDQMVVLLRQMGIFLKPNEIKTLVNAFDSNNDGTITLQEFLEFTGPKRDKKSGSVLALNRKCCWVTTDMVTGMANAYVVSALPKQGRKSLFDYKISESKSNNNSIILNDTSYRYNIADVKSTMDIESKDVKSSSEDMYARPNEDITGIITIRILPNGEKRMCVESKERKYREDILRLYQLLPNTVIDQSIDMMKDDNKKGPVDNKKKVEEKNEYADDFDEIHDGNDNNKEYAEDFVNDHITTNNISNDDMRCNVCKWTKDNRAKGLQYLLDISEVYRKEKLLQNKLSNGSVPKGPKLWCDYTYITKKNTVTSTANDNDGNDLSYVNPNELKVCWNCSSNSDIISFYILEFGNEKLSKKLNNDILYKEIFRDPIDAKPDSVPVYTYTVKDLKPGTCYLFRIRGFNGYGPGEYTYKEFVTSTGIPAAPYPMKVSSDAVLLKWIFSDTYYNRLDELKKIFHSIDVNHNNCISRKELVDILNNKDVSDSNSTYYSDLRTFIVRYARSNNIDISSNFDLIFEVIECDDNDMITWNEFQRFFMAAGWTEGSVTPSNATKDKVSMNALPSSSTTSSPFVTYIIEKCTSEIKDTYSPIVKTNLGHAMISHLQAGQSYRFRVYAVNAQGVAGPKSESVIVHTLLETPIPPTINISSITTTSIPLTWKVRYPLNLSHSSLRKLHNDRILNDWSGVSDDEPVNISLAFAKYDTNHTGYIQLNDISNLLTDLNISISDEYIQLVISVLDSNQTGQILYDDFEKWWKSRDVTYTIKRSEAVVGKSMSATDTSNVTSSTSAVQDTNGRRGSMGLTLSIIPEESDNNCVSYMKGTKNSETLQRSKSVNRIRSQSLSGPSISASVSRNTDIRAVNENISCPIVSYRGSQPRVVISGLGPNRLYYFTLRYIGSRSYSLCSKLTYCMTKPIRPLPPIVIVLGATTVRLKWYAPPSGTYKFILQYYKGSSNPIKSNTNTNVSTEDSNWSTGYSGQDSIWICNTLQTETTYHFRLHTINYQGLLSDPSEELVVTTLSRNDNSVSDNLAVKNVGNSFHIECTNDICIGDTIIFTEKLYKKHITRISATNSNDNEVMSVMSISNTLKNTIKPNSIPNSAKVDDSVYIGERTIAAHVVKDNYKSIVDIISNTTKNSLNTNNDVIDSNDNKNMVIINSLRSHTQDIAKARVLSLEVIWCKYKLSANSSIDISDKKYDIKSGHILNRYQNHLESYEVFRCMWKEEDKRESLFNEWILLQDCFVTYNIPNNSNSSAS